MMGCVKNTQLKESAAPPGGR